MAESEGVGRLMDPRPDRVCTGRPPDIIGCGRTFAPAGVYPWGPPEQQHGLCIGCLAKAVLYAPSTSQHELPNWTDMKP